MVKKYRYGDPVETGAVVENMPDCKEPISFLQPYQEGEQSGFIYKMSERDIVYGLGENVRGINKRGFRYISFCSDDYNHDESKRSLYGAHNFFMVIGKERFGVFIDDPKKISFDIGEDQRDYIKILSDCLNLYVYIITGDSAVHIVKQFREMIGRSYIPPRWAFGFQQSRWGYKDESDIRMVAEGYKKCKIPLDAIYMDIDYMERYKDFTVDSNKFPAFPDFVKEMKEDGIRLVPIIDAGVKIEDGYDIYEEGIENDYFCKKADGTLFVAGVWPGRTHFPDFLNKDARRWFGSKYQYLTDQGIEGFWNDMNEPAIFYSDDGVEKAWDKICSVKGEKPDQGVLHACREMLNGLQNSTEDYKRFYHNMDGNIVCHYDVHNLYGYNMTKSAGEALDEIEPDKRILLFSRASYIGMHRYGGIWTGDNYSWWSHLLLNIKMMPSIQMCGFLYTGADLGGFGAHCTRDLLLRFLQFGIFTPLMRNHSAIGTRDQECFRFEDPDDFKNIISVRYSLIPYIYSEYMKAAFDNTMYFRPLAFDYPDDERTHCIEDQLMLGDSVMVTPVYEQNARGRYVYLPEDMLFVRFKSAEDRYMEVLKRGHHYIEVELNEVPMFIRKNKLVPVCKWAERTDLLDLSTLEVLGYIEEESVYKLYSDDGFTKNYETEGNITSIKVRKLQDEYVVDSDSQSLKIRYSPV